MSTLHWDHTVQYVNHLDKSISIFHKNGLAAFHGGSHKKWGTHNALSYFGLTYIEFLSIENEDLVQQTDASQLVVKDALTFLPEHEAFSRVAIRTNDIEEIAASLTVKGLELSEIVDGKRLDAEGNLIEWRMLTIQGNFQGLAYPFIIQWQSTDEERLENLKSSGMIQTDPAGETIIEAAVFSVEDPKAAAEHWHNLFELAFTEKNAAEASLKIADQTFIFRKGAANRLDQLLFRTASADLKNKTLRIGEAEYKFL